MTNKIPSRLNTLNQVDIINLIQSLAGENESRISVEEFAHEYISSLKESHSESYLRSIKISFNHLQAFRPGSKKLISFGLRDAEAFMRYLQRSAPSGFRVYYRNLKAAFNKAISWGYIYENPFSKLKLSKQQKNKPATLTELEIKQILDVVSNEKIKTIIEIAYLTGVRLSEATNLRWKNVDLHRRLLTIGDENFETKGRKQRIVPIGARVYEIMKTLSCNKKNNDKEYVFTKIKNVKFTTDYISKNFKKAIRKLELDEALHFHSLRHSFGSNAAQKGIPLIMLRDLMGHSSVRVTEIYAHLNLDTLREAISRMDGSL